jgi:hypothetical protein
LTGPTPRFPRSIEQGIDQYLARRAGNTASIMSQAAGTDVGAPVHGERDAPQRERAP